MTENKKTRKKTFTIEEIYQNKNFVLPKEQNLETIFEEPRETKNGDPVFTSSRKYKRYLDFDPTQGKILKRKKNAKKCCSLLTKKGRTRSISKKSKEDDLNTLLEGLNESSDESIMDVTVSNTDEDDSLNVKVKESNERIIANTAVDPQSKENVEGKGDLNYINNDAKTQIESEDLDEKLICENINSKESDFDNFIEKNFTIECEDISCRKKKTQRKSFYKEFIQKKKVPLNKNIQLCSAI